MYVYTTLTRRYSVFGSLSSTPSGVPTERRKSLLKADAGVM
jgi:hypothetical protein